MTDLPSHYYDSIYGNDPSCENPFGLESLSRRCNTMLMEYLKRGGLLSEFARQSALARARLYDDRSRTAVAIGNDAGARSHHCDLPAISKREDVA